MNLEETVKLYLDKNGISKKFIAKLLGVSISDLNAIFNGRRKMKADELIIFCEYFGLDSAYLTISRACKSK